MVPESRLGTSIGRTGFNPSLGGLRGPFVGPWLFWSRLAGRQCWLHCCVGYGNDDRFGACNDHYDDMWTAASTIRLTITTSLRTGFSGNRYGNCYTKFQEDYCDGCLNACLDNCCVQPSSTRIVSSSYSSNYTDNKYHCNCK